MNDVWDWYILPRTGPIIGFASDPALVAALRIQRYWKASRVQHYVQGLRYLVWVRREYKQPVTLKYMGSAFWVAERSTGSFWFLPNDYIVLLNP